MGMEKYRVHEVAKDFGLPTKTITEILTKYVAAPKKQRSAAKGKANLIALLIIKFKVQISKFKVKKFKV